MAGEEKRFLEQLKHMLNEHNAGDIDVQMPVDEFTGDYREAAEVVNNLVNGHISVKKKAVACVDEFSKGNYDAELEQFPGKKAFINETIERLRTNVKSFVDDMKHMSDEHNAGDIDVQMPAEDFEGAYRVMAEGVNEMVNGHIAVKKKAMACVKEFGEGNFEAELERFPGKKAFINETIEQVRDNLKGLISETKMLTQAATKGELDTRGDAGKFGGDFGMIVQGVNDTLDAVIAPVNEAMDVMEKVANRDLTTLVTGDYKGQLNEFKENINAAVVKLGEALGQAAVASEQVGSASEQVSSSSQQLAEGAAEQASSLEETSSSLEEMSSMTKQNADNANQADSLMKESQETVGKANGSMNDLTSSMEEISKASEETSKIIKTIDEIAFQTNLLALNAAVEAARAGEAGAGFAVVADEVRNLAMRAADAAKNTSGLIEGTVKKVNAGSELVAKTNEAFKEVAESASKVGELVGEIAAASNEQAQGIEQVNTAMGEMDKVTQQNAANAEESASASEEMTAQAQELQSMIAAFKLSQEYLAQAQQQVAETQGTQPSVAQKAASQKRQRVQTYQTKAPKRDNAAQSDAVIPMNDGESEDGDFKDF